MRHTIPSKARWTWALDSVRRYAFSTSLSALLLPLVIPAAVLCLVGCRAQEEPPVRNGEKALVEELLETRAGKWLEELLESEHPKPDPIPPVSPYDGDPLPFTHHPDSAWLKELFESEHPKPIPRVSTHDDDPIDLTYPPDSASIDDFLRGKNSDGEVIPPAAVEKPSKEGRERIQPALETLKSARENQPRLDDSQGWQQWMEQQQVEILGSDDVPVTIEPLRELPPGIRDIVQQVVTTVPADHLRTEREARVAIARVLSLEPTEPSTNGANLKVVLKGCDAESSRPVWENKWVQLPVKVNICRTVVYAALTWKVLHSGQAMDRVRQAVNLLTESQPPATPPSPLPQVTIQLVWPEHNVSFDAGKGMVIHVRLKADNLQNEPLEAAAFFFFDDPAARQLRYTGQGQYACGEGELCVVSKFRPSDPTTESDVSLSLPYPALELVGSGTAYLKYFVVIRRAGGDSTTALATSGWQHFWYKQ
jgi:hypothetical protein